MTNIISRHIINPKITFQDTRHDEVFGYDDFGHMIDIWKAFLVEKYDVRPGQTIFINAGPTLHFYFSLAFAAAELGLVLIVEWVNCYTDDDIDNTRSTIYGTVDYVVIDSNQINEWTLKRNLKHSTHAIYLEEFKAYTVSSPEKYEYARNLFRCAPEIDFAIVTSSGTTSAPKPIRVSHEKMFKMSARIARVLGFEPWEKIMHRVSFQHGSTMSLHFLPSIMVCDQHHINNDAPATGAFAKYAQSIQANRVFLHTHDHLYDFLTAIDPVDFPLQILSLNHLTTDIVKLAQQKNIARLITSFGDTTIGDAFFLKEVLPDTAIESYEVLNQGPALDDFYQFRIEDGKLYIASRELNQDWKTSNDRFELRDGNYYFLGRAHVFRIGEEWVEFRTLESKVNELFFKDATLVFDFEEQAIYLAIWRENPVAEATLDQYLKDNFKNIRISYTMRNQKYLQFYTGRKIDSSKIRDTCRRLLDEQKEKQ